MCVCCSNPRIRLQWNLKKYSGCLSYYANAVWFIQLCVTRSFFLFIICFIRFNFFSLLYLACVWVSLFVSSPFYLGSVVGLLDILNKETVLFYVFIQLKYAFISHLNNADKLKVALFDLINGQIKIGMVNRWYLVFSVGLIHHPSNDLFLFFFCFFLLIFQFSVFYFYVITKISFVNIFLVKFDNDFYAFLITFYYYSFKIPNFRDSTQLFIVDLFLFALNVLHSFVRKEKK